MKSFYFSLVLHGLIAIMVCLGASKKKTPSKIKIIETTSFLEDSSVVVESQKSMVTNNPVAPKQPQIEQKITQTKVTTHKESNTATAKAALPSQTLKKVAALAQQRSASLNYRFTITPSSTDSTTQQWVINYLQENVELPEIDQVDLSLVISKQGIESYTLQSKSHANKSYLEQLLGSLQLPTFICDKQSVLTLRLKAKLSH